MNRKLVVSGVMATLGGLLLTTGCQSEVMAQRQYVPASAEKTPEEMTPAKETPALEPQQPAAKTDLESLPPLDKVVPPTPGKKHTVKPSTSGTYTVQKGDSIYKIARAHKVSMKALMDANNLTQANAGKIRIGQKLAIPAGGKASMAATASKAGKTAATAKKSAKATAKAAPGAAKAAVASEGGVYVIQKGDNIPKIARKLKVKTSELMAANNLDEAATRRLQVGQKLVIPGSGATVAATAGTQAPAQVNNALDAVGNALDKLSDAPAAEAKAVPATTPAAAEKVAPAEETVSGGSMPIEVKENVKIDDFVKKYNMTVDAFKKINPDVNVADGELKAGSVVFVPSAE